MNNRFPVVLNGLQFQSSEGLYQAMKFPTSSNRQLYIAHAQTGYDAKKRAYSATNEPLYENWNNARIDAMRLTLAVKLLQHPATIYDVLRSTGNKSIVEFSQKDRFWGASYNYHNDQKVYTGYNILGRLWSRLRDLAKSTDWVEVEAPIIAFLDPVQYAFTINNVQFTKESVLY